MSHVTETSAINCPEASLRTGTGNFATSKFELLSFVELCNVVAVDAVKLVGYRQLLGWKRVRVHWVATSFRRFSVQASAPSIENT